MNILLGYSFFKSVSAPNPVKPRYAPAFMDNLRNIPLASSAAAAPAWSQDHHHSMLDRSRTGRADKEVTAD